jgi:hypothetical protein
MRAVSFPVRIKVASETILSPPLPDLSRTAKSAAAVGSRRVV